MTAPPFDDSDPAARSPRTEETSLLYLVKQVELAIRARLEAVTREASLTGTQYTALTVLQRRPLLTSAQLAKNSFVRPQTMSAVTAELQERGFISREQDPHHQRRQLLSVTESGIAVLQELLPSIRQIEDQMVSSLSEVQIHELTEVLRYCRYALGGGWPR